MKVLKVNDRRDVNRTAGPAEVVALPGASEQSGQLKALTASFLGIKGLADQGRPDDAASAMTDAYFTDFEPLERLLNVRRPQERTPLESRFNAIRGRIGSGLKGSELANELGGLRGEVVAALGRAESATAGSFGLAFSTSLLTILREGVEVILLLTMLVALVAKTGHPRGLGAIKWGIGVAVAASVLTAVGLNLLVASAQGRTREVVEGAVMMAAAGVLFYVSYWLISQTQAKRWADFLKGRIAEGAKVGGLGTLALTAFLAVYREGAETALLYQAMIAGQGGSRDGLLGLAAGLAIGLVILAAVAVLIRSTSVKLPLRPFFQVTGFVLFAMAVVFAGNGVFELQSAGYIKTTTLDWLGSGLPALGFHPNTQALSIQGLLLLGGVLAFVLPGSPPGPSPEGEAASESCRLRRSRSDPFRPSAAGRWVLNRAWVGPMVTGLIVIGVAAILIFNFQPGRPIPSKPDPPVPSRSPSDAPGDRPECPGIPDWRAGREESHPSRRGLAGRRLDGGDGLGGRRDPPRGRHQGHEGQPQRLRPGRVRPLPENRLFGRTQPGRLGDREG